jgi:hypothetical protein
VFVVKTQAEDRETMPRVLQNSTVDNFLSADFVGKIYAVLNRRLEIYSTPGRPQAPSSYCSLYLRNSVLDTLYSVGGRQVYQAGQDIYILRKTMLARLSQQRSSSYQVIWLSHVFAYRRYIILFVCSITLQLFFLQHKS